MNRTPSKIKAIRAIIGIIPYTVGSPLSDWLIRIRNQYENGKTAENACPKAGIAKTGNDNPENVTASMLYALAIDILNLILENSPNKNIASI